MSHFLNIEELNKAFTTGKFKLDSEIVVENLTYTLFEVAPVSIVESIRGKRPMAIYISEQVDDAIVFCWEVNSRNAIQPVGCALFEGEGKKIKNVLSEAQMDDKITIRPDQLVGDLVRVSFTGLNNPKELQGKIDTGATVSSLHADRYKINGNQIEFSCKPLTDNLITIPLKTQHAVKSPDGGTVYRPVVELDVKVNGKLIQGAMFNLNDRSHMDQPVLIGQNILQAGKFFVDPSKSESESKVDWEMIHEATVGIPFLWRTANDEVLKEFYENMLESDITFDDLVRYIKREVIKTFEDIE
jgi:hypothetical protein